MLRRIALPAGLGFVALYLVLRPYASFLQFDASLGPVAYTVALWPLLVLALLGTAYVTALATGLTRRDGVLPAVLATLASAALFRVATWAIGTLASYVYAPWIYSESGSDALMFASALATVLITRAFSSRYLEHRKSAEMHSTCRTSGGVPLETTGAVMTSRPRTVALASLALVAVIAVAILLSLYRSSVRTLSRTQADLWAARGQLERAERERDYVRYGWQYQLDSHCASEPAVPVTRGVYLARVVEISEGVFTFDWVGLEGTASSPVVTNHSDDTQQLKSDISTSMWVQRNTASPESERVWGADAERLAPVWVEAGYEQWFKGEGEQIRKLKSSYWWVSVKMGRLFDQIVEAPLPPPPATPPS